MNEDVRDAVPGGAPGEGASAPGAELPVEETPAQVLEPDTGAPAAEPEPDWKDRWLRSEAELQNFRRRAQRDREDAVARAQEGVLLEMIAVLDDLERALASLAPDQAEAPWAKGVELTAQRLREGLARFGVVEIDALGRPFDPAVHDAMVEIDAPEGIAPGAVAQVFQKGWRRGERALRAARVVVAKSAAPEAS